MSKRPRTLQIGRDERPPVPTLALLAAQHASFAIIYLAYALLVAKGAGFTAGQQSALLSGTLLSCGIGALLQATTGRFGSGLLILPIASPTLLTFLIQAGSDGGPSAMASVVLIAGAIQFAMGPLILQARALFPPEVCGVVTAMLGLTLVNTGINLLLARPGASSAILLVDGFIALLTLSAILAATIWLKGSWRFFALVIGAGLGSVAAALFGRLSDLSGLVAGAPLLLLPWPIMPASHVDLTALPMIALMALVSTVYSMGVLINTERLDDADWTRPDFARISRGVSSMGLANLASALLGGSHIGMSSSSTGVAFATGVTSRVVGSAAGLMLIGVSLFPKLTALIMGVPEAVLAGLLAFVAIFFVVTGFQLALSRMMSPRRLILIGLPLCAGVAASNYASMTRGIDGFAGALLHSPLALTAFLAILLSMLMRIGIAQTAHMSFVPGKIPHDELRERFEALGEQWGLRPLSMRQACDLASETVEALEGLAEGAVDLEIRHDDAYLHLNFNYEGPQLLFPDRAPTAEEMLSDPDAMRLMSGWLLRNMAGRVRLTQQSGRSCLALRLEN